MTERTGHLVQKKHQCPWCGERRMHKRILYEGCTRNRCLSCGGTFPAMNESASIVFDVGAVNLIKGALQYTAEDSGASEDKAQGIIVGVATTLMAGCHITLEEAMTMMRHWWPDSCRVQCIPKAWLPLL